MSVHFGMQCDVQKEQSFTPITWLEFYPLECLAKALLQHLTIPINTDGTGDYIGLAPKDDGFIRLMKCPVGTVCVNTQ